MLTLWAVVAERLSFDRDEPLIFGRAVDGLNVPYNGMTYALLRADKRWQYNSPLRGSTKFIWVPQIFHHVAPTCIARLRAHQRLHALQPVQLGEIRRDLIEADLVGCLEALPNQLFCPA